MASPPARYPHQMITMVTTEMRGRIEALAVDENGQTVRSLSDVQREALELGLPLVEARAADAAALSRIAPV